MPTEKPIQDLYIRLLDIKDIPWLHIPSRAFSTRYRTPHNLKFFPDLLFYFNGQLFLRELGVEGRHKWRKGRQLEVMQKWKKNGADIAVILSEEAALKDMAAIGLSASRNNT